jgi:RimJ/RimL family protein N-acetyltransferase
MTQTPSLIPVLTTERLTLGRFDMAHFEAFAAFCETERSVYLGGPTTDRREAWDSCMIHLGHWQARGYGAFFATETATGKPAGRFSLWHPITLDEPELSWLVYDGFEGKGYAEEGARAVRDWATARGFAPLQSLIAEANTRSVALATRLGCTAEGRHAYPSGTEVLRYRHPAGVAA